MLARLGSRAIGLESGCRYRTRTVGLVDTRTGEVSSKRIADVLPVLPKFAELNHERPKRGEIKSLSLKSRRRLKFVLANMKPKFLLTLTYPDVREHRSCYRNLNTLLTWFRSIGIQNYVWVAEMQDRGALHFHLIFEDEKPIQKLWDAKNVVLDAVTTITRPRIAFVWASITGSGIAGIKSATRLERVRTEKGGKSYIAKYLQKGSSSKWSGRRWGANRIPAESYRKKNLVRCLYRILDLRQQFRIIDNRNQFLRLKSIIKKWNDYEDQLSTRPSLFGDWCIRRKAMGFDSPLAWRELTCKLPL